MMVHIGQDSMEDLRVTYIFFQRPTVYSLSTITAQTSVRKRTNVYLVLSAKHDKNALETTIYIELDMMKVLLGCMDAFGK